ncbi:MAG: TolC family protein, partial [Mariprofundaceae bacterium]|nr:TolC family protein [Mariprofundaceae bacterium]
MMPLRVACLFCAVALSACVVGPDFKSPEAPKAQRYTDATLSVEQADSEAGQKVVTGKEVPTGWWNMFGSETLNGLVERGLANSLTVAVAKARLRQAQENLNAQTGSVLYPSIDGKFSGTRQQASGAPFGGSSIYFSLLDASLSASYGIDLFGASKRYLESLTSQLDYEQYQLQAARMSLTTNIVTASVLEASLRGQIAATKQIIADSEAQLSMIEQRFALGAVAQSGVLSQRSALAQARTALPGLLKQLQQNRHLLNVL